LQAKQDYLEGLKENVIVGHRIPAGTGLRKFQEIIVTNTEDLERAEQKAKQMQGGVELIG
jgi:DNA-directed RNA polymerase subunit beta'